MAVWDRSKKDMPRASAYVQSRSESARSTANTRVVVTAACARAARKNAASAGLIDMEVIMAQPREAVINLFQLFLIMRVKTVEEMVGYIFPNFRRGAMGTEDEPTPRAFRKLHEPAAEDSVRSAVEAMLYRQQAATPTPHTTYNVVTNIPDIRDELQDLQKKNAGLFPALQKHALQSKYKESLRYLLSQLLAHNAHGTSFGGADLYPRLMQLGMMVRQAALLHFGLRQPDDIDAGPHQYYLDPSAMIMQIVKFLFRRHHHRWLSQLRKGQTDPSWLRWYLAFTIFNRMRSGNLAPTTNSRHLSGVTQGDRNQPVPLAGHDALRLEVGIRHRQTQQSEAKLRVDMSIQFSRMADNSITTRDLQRLVGMYVRGLPLVRRRQEDLPPGVIRAEELEKQQMQEDEEMAAAALRGEELPPKSRTPSVSPFELTAKDAPFIIVDGAVVGRLVYPETVRGAVDMLRTARRNGNLPWDAAVYFSPHTTAVCVWRLPGTVYWPVILTHRLADFMHLVGSGVLPPIPEMALNILQAQGIIEWVCAAEVQWGHRRIAPTFVELGLWKKDDVPFDAVCLHQLQPFFTGVVSHASAIESVRLTFSTKQLRQASGFSMAMHKYALHEPVCAEQHLSPTVTTDLFENDQKMWVGCYALVAFVCLLDTTEDAVVLNRQATQRGLGQHIQYVHARYLLKLTSSKMKNMSILTVPLEDPTFEHVPRLRANYSMLGSDGIIKRGSTVQYGAVLVRRIKREVTTINGQQTKTFTDDSVVFHRQLVWTVHDVQVDERLNAVNFTFSRLHAWSDGDKITTMHASKGTFVTMDDIDLPQVSTPYGMPQSPYEGVTPNMVINPLTLLKRGLVGPAFEACSNELAIAIGDTVYGTSLRPMDWEAMKAELEKRGAGGSYRMIDGRTGRPFKTPIFMAHLRILTMIKHRPAISTHARGAHGLTNAMGQAVRGRARDGGVRQSEVTSSLLAASGVGHTPVHLVKASDGAVVPVCVKCGRLGVNPPKTIADAIQTSVRMAPETATVERDDVAFLEQLTRRAKKCLNDACGGEIVKVTVPMSMLVASQKLSALNIAMRFMAKPDDSVVHRMRGLALHEKEVREQEETLA
jgi:DNA-directed RNA polymerase beta subunit